MAFLMSWVKSALKWLGFEFPKNAKIIFVGLENAGKTTLLRYLADGRLTASMPTDKPYARDIQVENLRAKIFDLGGHEPARVLWADYVHGVHGVVFLVDASAPEKFPTARKELNTLLNDCVGNTPLVVLGNKIDSPGAVSEGQLRAALGLVQTAGKDIKTENPDMPCIEVFMCSVVAGMGFSEGLKWLAARVNARAE